MTVYIQQNRKVRKRQKKGEENKDITVKTQFYIPTEEKLPNFLTN